MKGAADNLAVSSKAKLSVIAPIGIANREVVLHTADASITSLNFYNEVAVVSGYRSSVIARLDIPIVVPVVVVADIPVMIPVVIIANVPIMIPVIIVADIPIVVPVIVVFHLW